MSMDDTRGVPNRVPADEGAIEVNGDRQASDSADTKLENDASHKPHAKPLAEEDAQGAAADVVIVPGVEPPADDAFPTITARIKTLLIGKRRD